MHLISTIPGGWNPNEEGVFHIEQSCGDLLFLTAADNEIIAMDRAVHALMEVGIQVPVIRMANLTYLKQELTIDTYLEEVLDRASVVVLRMLGGSSYYPYLFEQLEMRSERNSIKLVFLPGHDQPDPQLMAASNVPVNFYHTLWQYFVEGGVENLQEALKLCSNQFFKTNHSIANRKTIPAMFLYDSKRGIWQSKIERSSQNALIIGYRSHFVSGNMEVFHTLESGLQKKGFSVVFVLGLSFRSEAISSEIQKLLKEHALSPTIVLNTTGFALSALGNSKQKSVFATLNVPIIQAMVASCNAQVWKEGQFGLPPTDMAMNIALPEVDGKIIGQPIAFKTDFGKSAATDSTIIGLASHPQGVHFTSDLAHNLTVLQRKENRNKRIALILPNYPNKNSRLANGVGLDTPQSTINILAAMQMQGYDLGEDAPKTVPELMELLTSYVTNDLEFNTFKDAAIRLPLTQYEHYYQSWSDGLKEKIENQWGSPSQAEMLRENEFFLPGVLLGNVFLSIQPNRGYQLDLQANYHSPDLPPTHDYLAFYFWLKHAFSADAMVHIGKHGNLEWLPGKSIALDLETCFPAALMGAVPHFYPFIINDPGEGSQAKRRAHAVVLDHMIPPMTRAESYGALLTLEQYIEEYYEAALLDTKRAEHIKTKIEALVKDTELRQELAADPKDMDALLLEIDGYLCELKEAQIRGGLHIYGTAPEAELLVDTIVALHRLPQEGHAGLTQLIARALELEVDPINCSFETPCSIEILGKSCSTVGKVVEQLERIAQHLLLEDGFDFGGKAEKRHELEALLEFIRVSTLKKIEATTEEIDYLMRGLSGQFVPPGGSGAPTRGRLEILPTGRNFYSVDIRTVPTEAAYALASKSAAQIITRYLQENGEYPEAIAISVWGTSTMRTGGDDIAQALALMGVEPKWNAASRRVEDFKVISLLALKRPRVDVTLRISGFFRDAFPDIIALYNAVVQKLIALDELLDANPIKRRYLEEKENWKAKGLDSQVAEQRATYRVFGSKPGAYGAGLQGVIDGQNWKDLQDLATVYMNWSGYAYYGEKNEGHHAHEAFENRLNCTDIVMQNQDNREHDILDSDDYYQFQGGLAAAVTVTKGESPALYFGDHSRPERPVVKTLQQELRKVYRSRAVNPKWIKAMQNHGYKGAFEMAATMDYLFAYDATTNLVDDFMYEGMVNAYLMEAKNLQFIKEHNPWAIKDMSERMLEAIQRGMWQNPDPKIEKALQSLYAQGDAWAEKEGQG